MLDQGTVDCSNTRITPWNRIAYPIIIIDAAILIIEIEHHNLSIISVAVASYCYLQGIFNISIFVDRNYSRSFGIAEYIALKYGKHCLID